jgi:hypothetical protein
MEHENDAGVEEILDDELQKLMDVKAMLKVLVFYPSVPVFFEAEQDFPYPEIIERIRSARIKNNEESYIIITPSFNESQGFVEVFACTISPDGKCKSLERKVIMPYFPYLIYR